MTAIEKAELSDKQKKLVKATTIGAMSRARQTLQENNLNFENQRKIYIETQGVDVI